MSFKKQIATFLTTFAALIAGVAFAAWTATGTGSGSAKAGHSSALVITATGTTPTSLLYPSGNAPVYMNVTNNNPFTVTVTNLDPGTGNAVTSDNVACNTEGTGVTLNSVGSLSISLPGNGVTTAVNVPGASSMSTSSGNDCQDATFTFSAVTLTGHS
jgi:hypothetical protein